MNNFAGGQASVPELNVGYLIGEIIMLILSLGGLFLNLLVVYILLIRIRILKIDTVLSCLITVFDLVATISLMIRIIYKWSTLENPDLYNDPVFCKISGTIFFASTISSFDVISMLGAIRCLIIVFSIKFDSLYWGILLGLIMAYNWIGATCLQWNFTEISWGQFCSHKKIDSFEKSSTFGPIISLKAVLMVLVVCVSYSLIYRFYQTYYDRMKRDSSTDQALISEITSQKTSTSLKLLGLIVAYILIYLPKILIFILYNFNLWPFDNAWEVATSVLLSMSSLINASVILFIQEETKHEWQVLMALLFHRVKSVY